jgi:beta-lactamase regulating signal transducer with metallopeptidase domain
MNITMTLASAAAFSLLHSLWELALLALLAAVHLASLRRASANARHAVGMGGLLAMAAAPAITFAFCWHAMAPSASTAGPWFGAVPPAPDAAAVASTLLASTWSGWLLACLAQVWLLGVVLMVVRQFGGWRALRRIEHAPSVPLPAPWQQRFDVLRHAMGVSRSVSVRVAEHLVSPFTAHVLRPLVWLPLSLLTQLPREQLEALLAHELAHIRRLDWCWNTLQCAIEAVLFHHPAMWWLSRRVREEREHACDDLAVAVCGDPIVLAEALASLQRTSLANATPRLALAAQGGFLMRRVMHLLSSPNARRPDWRWPGVLLLLLCSGTLLAMQVVPPASILTNLHSDASSQGGLTPGNFREFTATYLGARQRHYRIEMDGSGQVREVYTEDGKPKLIDTSVRAWLHTVSSMADISLVPSTAPAAPMPQVAAAPALPPALAVPPVPAIPAPPPKPAESTEFKLLLTALEADPLVVARTGQPAAMVGKSFHGHVHTWGERDFHLWGIDDPVGGTADFTVTIAGPQGQVEVAWSGQTVKGIWTADRMAIASPPH